VRADVRRTRRRHFLENGLALAGLGLLAGCGLVRVPSPRPRRIGFLESGPPLIPPTIESFREGLRDLGYVEGENLIIEYRDAEVHLERLPALAAELVGIPVEVIVASNAPTALAASQATATIPIVAAGGNVVAVGLVTRVAHPEGNITGVTTNSVEAIGKWVELLQEVAPTMSRLAVAADLSNLASQPFLEAVEHATQALRLQHTVYDVPDLDRFAETLAAAKADGADSLVVVSGGAFRGGNDVRIGSGALNARLPAVAEGRAFAVNGGLLAHGADTVALARRSASYVDKILRGARPGDLPIELPTTFNIVVNLKTARSLGLTIPQSVLQQATEIVQ
jgi:putative tryptophan/tyrosine transport system substrate-binding protein